MANSKESDAHNVREDGLEVISDVDERELAKMGKKSVLRVSIHLSSANILYSFYNFNLQTLSLRVPKRDCSVRFLGKPRAKK